jgi:hypothetical protein
MHQWWEGDMTSLAASLAERFLPVATRRVADFEPLATIALFCGIGLLVSILTLLMYMHTSPAQQTIGPAVTLSLEEVQANVDVNRLPNLEFEDQSLIFSTPKRR